MSTLPAQSVSDGLNKDPDYKMVAKLPAISS